MPNLKNVAKAENTKAYSVFVRVCVCFLIDNASTVLFLKFLKGFYKIWVKIRAPEIARNSRNMKYLEGKHERKTHNA
jgi:hypothetical protein